MTLRAHGWAARAVLAAATGGAYLYTVAPGPGWLDASEFIAGAHTLGVVHPPGHPLYVMLAKAWSLVVPLGSVAFRINLLSAVLAVACALLVMALVRRTAEHVRAPSAGVTWCAAAAGLLFATTHACWMQSVRAEVYTLNAALILAAMVLAVRWVSAGQTRHVLAATVLLGLGLCNHHYLVFFFLPAPLMLLLLRAEGRALLASRRVLAVFALGAVTLLAYAYLPLRASTDPVINWADPTTVQRFIDTITAKAWSTSATAASREAPVADNLATAFGMLIDDLGPVAFLLGLVGLVWLTVRSRALGVFLGLTLLGNLMSRAILLVDPNNPDDYGYLLLGVAVLAASAGLAFTLVRPGSSWRRALPGVGAVLLAVYAVWVAREALPRVDLSRDTSADAFTDATLDRVAPDAVVLVNFYSVFFNAWHAQLVDARRPDVAIVHATFDAGRYEGAPYVASLRRRWDHLGPVLDEFQATGEYPHRALRTLAASRPVYVEPLPEQTQRPEELEPAGLVRRIGPPTPHDAVAASLDAAFWHALLRQLNYAGPPHREARKILTWFHFVHACLALRQRRPATALQILERSGALADSGAIDRLRVLAEVQLGHERRAASAPADRAPFLRLRAATLSAFLRELRYLELL